VLQSVLRDALGSRDASGRISREQTSERIIAVWGKQPEAVARSPIQILNDKGRSLQESDTAHLR
jgi:hypothetical protein